MSPIGEPLPLSAFQRLRQSLAPWSGLVRGYFSAVSGSAGRLVFSLLYFVALANTLPLAEFGLFATSSAAGVVIARLLGFGFISALYRTATVRPRMLGLATGGFLALGALSLPLIALAAWGMWLVFFASEVTLGVFAAFVAAEALLWRPFEAVVIVNNGLNRFGRAAALVIMGTGLRAVAAFAFMFLAEPTLAAWSLFYLAANAAALLIAVLAAYPRRRLRFHAGFVSRRLPDSVAVAGAEALFYVQSELDKLLVLSLGGAKLAGIYAIVMRLADLTAIPIRAFSMLLVQKIMRTPDLLKSIKRRVGLEAGVFAASTLALLALAVFLRLFPGALGDQVAEAAPLLLFALLIPAFRNLVEYQAELLYARGQTPVRALNLALLAGLKGVLLAHLLRATTDTGELVLALNGVFAALYLASLVLTYSAIRLPRRPV